MSRASTAPVSLGGGFGLSLASPATVSLGGGFGLSQAFPALAGGFRLSRASTAPVSLGGGLRPVSLGGVTSVPRARLARGSGFGLSRASPAPVSLAGVTSVHRASLARPVTSKGTTRFTVKKDYEYIQENHDEEQQHEHHEAHRARQPQQPNPQQIAEHNLTHLPYRNWCPICVQGKGRQDNFKKQQSRQPVIQVDFAYIKSQQGPKTIPVLTAVDVTTQLCMAVMVPDKPSMMDYIL